MTRSTLFSDGRRTSRYLAFGTAAALARLGPALGQRDGDRVVPHRPRTARTCRLSRPGALIERRCGLERECGRGRVAACSINGAGLQKRACTR